MKKIRSTHQKNSNFYTKIVLHTFVPFEAKIHELEILIIIFKILLIYPTYGGVEEVNH